MDALHRALPALGQQLASVTPKRVFAAGDPEMGFFLVSQCGKLIDGMAVTAYQCLHVPDDEVERFAKDLAAQFATLKEYESIFLSGLPLYDLVPRIAAQRPYTIEGLPFIIYFIEPDPEMFVAVLHTIDISDLLLEKRFVPFVGQDYTVQILDWYGANPLAPSPNLVTVLPPDVFQTLNILKADLEQPLMVDATKEIEQITAQYEEISAYYDGIPEDEWRRKFFQGPLRALILAEQSDPSIEQYAHGISHAMMQLGHEVVIVTGTGPVTSLTVRAVLDLVHENRPDIIIDLNGHRYLCEAAFPQPLPVP